MGVTFKQTGTYRLLYVGGAKAAPGLAMPADFLPGETVLPSGNNVPVMLSEIAKHQGHTVFFQGPAKKYNDAALSRWLHDTFFEGHGLLEMYGISLAQGLLVFLIALPFGVRADMRRFRELNYGRRLKGPIMLAPAQFNRALKADGLGIETTEKPKFPNKQVLLRIPKSAEAKHVQIMGDTGTGKTTTLAAIREGAEKGGYKVEGFAPTSKAAGQLRGRARVVSGVEEPGVVEGELVTKVRGVKNGSRRGLGNRSRNAEEDNR